MTQKVDDQSNPSVASATSAELGDELDPLAIAFLQGAKWWEFEKTGATMWQSDQSKAIQAAYKMLGQNKLGKLTR